MHTYCWYFLHLLNDAAACLFFLGLQMGKRNFKHIYQAAHQDLGQRPAIKLSTFCDRYSPNSNYAGIIIYHSYGKFQWQQKPGQGVAAGSRGRAFYVLIVCTDNWPEGALREAGQGRVHDYLYRQYFNMEYSYGQTCCGGFSVLEGSTKYSSIWLNQQNGKVKGKRWQSDGHKHLSVHEQNLVDVAIREWKRGGGGKVAQVPNWLHSILM